MSQQVILKSIINIKRWVYWSIIYMVASQLLTTVAVMLLANSINVAHPITNMNLIHLVYIFQTILVLIFIVGAFIYNSIKMEDEDHNPEYE